MVSVEQAGCSAPHRAAHGARQAARRSVTRRSAAATATNTPASSSRPLHTARGARSLSRPASASARSQARAQGSTGYATRHANSRQSSVVLAAGGDRRPSAPATAASGGRCSAGRAVARAASDSARPGTAPVPSAASTAIASHAGRATSCRTRHSSSPRNSTQGAGSRENLSALAAAKRSLQEAVREQNAIGQERHDVAKARQVVEEATLIASNAFEAAVPAQCGAAVTCLANVLTRAAPKALVSAEAARFFAVLVALLHHPTDECREAALLASISALDLMIALRLAPRVLSLNTFERLDPARRYQFVQNILKVTCVVLASDAATMERFKAGGGLVIIVEVWSQSANITELARDVMQLVLLFAPDFPKTLVNAGGADIVLASWQRASTLATAIVTPRTPRLSSRLCSGNDSVVSNTGHLTPAERRTSLLGPLSEVMLYMLPHLSKSRCVTFSQFLAQTLTAMSTSGPVVADRMVVLLLQLAAKLGHKDVEVARELVRGGAHRTVLDLLIFEDFAASSALRQAAANAWVYIIVGLAPESRRQMSTSPRLLSFSESSSTPRRVSTPRGGNDERAGGDISASSSSSSSSGTTSATASSSSTAALAVTASSRANSVHTAATIPAGNLRRIPPLPPELAVARTHYIPVAPALLLPPNTRAAALRRHLPSQLPPVSLVAGITNTDDERGRVVFPQPSSAKAAQGGDYLSFDASFEGANLRHVVAINWHEYEVQVAVDFANAVHVQWFFWQVRGMLPGVVYTFHILNLSKPTSLFSEGMQPVMFSRRRLAETGVAWTREGSNIAYYGNGGVLAGGSKKDGRQAHSLSFTLEFPHENDTVYLAHVFPYGYGDLRDDISRWMQGVSFKANSDDAPSGGGAEIRPAPWPHMELKELLRTPGGLSLPAIRVGTVSASKPTAVLIARAHPGEVPASWIMRGVCEFLIAHTTAEASACRDQLSWLLLPMLNPDGVVVGNTRTNLAGVDLNRHHHDDSAPENVALKTLMNDVIAKSDGSPPLAFIDIHGHSRRRGIFLMGNLGASPRLPEILAKESPLFDHEGSSMLPAHGARDAGVGRVAAAARGCPHSFTMEASFGMATECDHQFTPQDLESMGPALCIALRKLVEETNPATPATPATIPGEKPSPSLTRQFRDSSKEASRKLIAVGSAESALVDETDTGADDDKLGTSY